MDTQWQQVPYRIKGLYIKYASEMRQLMTDFPDHEGAWVLDTPEVGVVKSASAQAPLKPATDLSRQVQQLFGGPNPLTAALLYGALGSGLGWGTGKLMHMLWPERVKRDASWRFGLPLGALLGSAGAMGLHGYPNLREHGWKGLFMPSAIQKQSSIVPRCPANMLATPADCPRANETLADIVERAEEATNTWFVPDDDLQKAAARGNDFVPDIDVPYWMDVVRRDPVMPAPTKALVAGLPAGAAAAKGNRWVTPKDVAFVAANAGLGAAIGNVIGRVAGPVIRLTPKAQADIQKAGLLAGIFRSLGVM